METPIPTDPLEALEEYKRLEVKLEDWPPNNQSDEYKAHINRMHAVGAVAFAQPEPLSFVMDGDAVGAALEKLTRMKALQQTFPYGSPEATAMNAAIMKADAAYRATLPPQPVDGAPHNWPDYRKSESIQRLGAARARELELRIKKAGGDSVIGVRVGAALRTFLDQRPHPEYGAPLDYDEATVEAVTRTLTAAGFDADGIEALRQDGLFNDGGQELVDVLAQADEAIRQAKR